MRALLVALALAACAEPPPSKAKTPAQRSLAGTSWVIVQDENARGAPTLEFRAASRANGFTGCNQWFAQVEREGGRLRFKAIGMTRRACEPSVMEIERDFAVRLERTRSARFDENTLTLIAENGEILARFERMR